jgi:CheY-like chemotaxis protein
MMAMTDTGCGMTPDVLEHAFEPFFTTKPDGQGTGLGLSMVWGLVKQSDGHIKVYSEPGQGTTIRIYLPRSPHQEDVATEIDSGPITGGTETVLIVEDDEDVRVTVVDLLSDLGYRVLKARDAQGALAIIESGVPIDLLFTDVVMPGTLRSPELARKARERLPTIAVLFTSGYTENAIFHGGRLDEGIDLLSKPYTRESLARKIRHVLGNQQQRTGHAPPNAPRSAISVGPAAEQAPARKLTVLLVEDDTLIRLSTAEMLENIGHSVVEAANAEDALARLGSAVIDVLVTDVRLPSMSGVELAIRARRQCPELRVIFASGADIVPGLGDADALENATLLKKPYDERDLIGVLGQ